MPSGTTSSDPVRVLVVDDNDAMRARAAALLARGFTVVGAVPDAKAALAAASDTQPDVIVIDISMPGMNGLDLAGQLRARGSHAAVVFLTVHDEADIVQAAQRARRQMAVADARHDPRAARLREHGVAGGEPVDGVNHVGVVLLEQPSQRDGDAEPSLRRCAGPSPLRSSWR